MTRIRPIPETKDPATLRLELELLLQQPVPGPEQLERALPLLHSVDNISADQWRNLQALPLWVDTETLDLAVPSDWEEPEWRSLINALPESGRTVRLHPVLQQDLIHALTDRNGEATRTSRLPSTGEEPSETRDGSSDESNSVEATASSFLEGFHTEGVLEATENDSADLSNDAVDLEASLQDADAGTGNDRGGWRHRRVHSAGDVSADVHRVRPDPVRAPATA